MTTKIEEFIAQFEAELVHDDLLLITLLEQALGDPHLYPGDYSFLEASIVAVCMARNKLIPRKPLSDLGMLSVWELLNELGIKLTEETH